MKKLTALIFLFFIMVFSGLAQDKKINVLVFSKTMGFRHNSISSGLKMMSDLAQERKWVLTATENDDYRSFYTGFGHTPEAFEDPKVKAHIGNAVDWGAKRN